MTIKVHSQNSIIVDCKPKSNFPIEIQLTFGESAPQMIKTPAGAWLNIEDAEWLVARLQQAIVIAHEAVIDLEEALDRLAALQPKAQAIWVRNMRNEAGYGEDWQPDGEVWLSLEYEGRDGYPWECGFRVQLGGATEWALRVVRSTPLEAARAMLESLEKEVTA